MPFRILIADDDLHTRRILETLLSREPGLRSPEIVTASDGQDALAALDRFVPDVVITDLLMPRMDGFAFARALRRHPSGAKVPLLVTSAIYKDRAQLSQLEHEVGAEFYAKPYQLREMVRAVIRIVAEPVRPKRPRSSLIPASSPERAEPVALAAPPLPGAGSLADRPLPRLLFDLFEAQATGVLHLSRARLRKEIFILFGHPIGAESNLRSETLGQLLLARGVVDPARLAQALEAAGPGRDRLGAVMVERGWMKEAEVLNYLAAQVRLKIVSALRWQDGDFRFLPGDTFSGRMTHLTVDAPRTVLTGLRRTAHVDEIARGALASQGRLRLGSRFRRHRDAFVRVFGDTQLALLTDGPRPREMALRNDPELMAQYEALMLTGLGQLAADGVPQPVASDTSGPFDEAASRREALYHQLFGDEESPSSMATRAPSLDLTIEDSGVFPMPQPPGHPGAPSSPSLAPALDDLPSPFVDPRVEVAREALLREYLSLHAQGHYDRLRVRRDAGTDEISRAYAARLQEFRPERFAGVDLGRDHARLEEIHAALTASYEVLSDSGRRSAYDRSFVPTQPRITVSLPLHEAEARFREGIRLLHAEQPEDAVARLEEAARAAPEQADYHAMLGWARFQAREPGADLQAAARHAREALEQAFAIDPDHVGAHEFRGRIGFVLGDDADAVGHLERALHVDPTRNEALMTLEALCLRTGQHQRLVQQLRSLIARLGEARAAPLWHDLAVLLRDHVGDKAAARGALETYLRLVPDDTRARKTLDRLATASPLPEQQDEVRAAVALRTAWHAAPGNLEPLRQLFRLHVGAARPDAALAAASALVARGAGDDEAAAYVKRHRPRFLRRAISQLAWTQIDALRHPDDDRDLAPLFTRLFAAAPPEPDVAFFVGSEIPVESLAPPFVQVLGYVAWLLGVAPPAVAQGDVPGTGMRVLMRVERPALLAVSPAVLALTDKVMLAFRLGRALAGLYPARAHALSLSAHRLKSYLAAATALIGAPSEMVDDGEAQRLRDRVAAFPNLATDVRPIVERIAARSDRVNLSRWLRGIVHTAERIGLVACNDLLTAVRILGEEGAPATDLIDFALTDELQAVREAVGLTIAV